MNLKQVPVGRILVLTLCFFSLCAHAQDEVRLYQKKTDIAEKIANKIAKMHVKDSMPEASFREAILECFENYWINKNSKSKLKLSLLETKQAERVALQTEMVTLRDSVAKLKSAAGQVNAEQIEQQILDAQEEALAANNLFKEKKEELVSKQKALEEKRASLDKFQNSGNKLQALAENVNEQLAESYRQCSSGKLSETGILLMTQALSDFEENQADIKELVEADKYETMVKHVATVKKYLPLCNALNKAVEQMGSKRYDEKINEILKTEIKSCRVSMSKSQQDECNAIVFALEHQKSAYKNLNSILEDVNSSEDFPNINISESIEFMHSILDKELVETIDGRTYYNHYYKVFNKELDNLRKNIPAIKKKEKLESYLNEIRNKL